jgi:hypothetical protein
MQGRPYLIQGCNARGASYGRRALNWRCSSADSGLIAINAVAPSVAFRLGASAQTQQLYRVDLATDAMFELANPVVREMLEGDSSQCAAVIGYVDQWRGGRYSVARVGNVGGGVQAGPVGIGANDSRTIVEAGGPSPLIAHWTWMQSQAMMQCAANMIFDPGAPGRCRPDPRRFQYRLSISFSSSKCDAFSSCDMYGYIYVENRAVEQILKVQDVDSRRYDANYRFSAAELEAVTVAIVDADALNADQSLGSCQLRVSPDVLAAAALGQSVTRPVFCDRWSGTFTVGASLR